MVSEITADSAAAGGRVVGLADTGEKKQAGIAEGPGGEDYERGGLKKFFAAVIDVSDATGGGFRVGAEENAADPGAGAQDDVFSFLDDGEKKVGGLSFGADHAAESSAESAKGASTARDAIGIGVRLADGGGWRSVGVIAERFGGVAKKGGEIRDLGGGSRVLLTAPAFEDVSAVDFCTFEISSLTGDAEQFFSLCVIGFEFVIRDAPIADRVIRGKCRLAVFRRSSRVLFITVGKEPGALGVPMFARAANACADLKSTVLT